MQKAEDNDKTTILLNNSESSVKVKDSIHESPICKTEPIKKIEPQTIFKTTKYDKELLQSDSYIF